MQNTEAWDTALEGQQTLRSQQVPLCLYGGLAYMHLLSNEQQYAHSKMITFLHRQALQNGMPFWADVLMTQGLACIEALQRCRNSASLQAQADSM